MARFLSTLLVVGLLAGTTAAFAVTEGLKLSPSPVTGTRIEQPLFAPTCDCESSATTIDFRLRKSDDVTLGVVGPAGRVVRTLVDHVHFGSGPLTFGWDGRDDAGNVVADGVYRPRVHLARAHKTIVLPSKLTVDTRAPRLRALRLLRAVVSPDGDRRHDLIQLFYRLDQPARPILFVDGRLVEQKRLPSTKGSIVWNGRLDGRQIAPGVHHLTVAARDEAGNLSRARAARIVVRYVVLARHVVRVAAAGRIVVGVSTDAQPLHWRLGRKRGITFGRRVVVRAPDLAGLYRLVVAGAGHTDRARVVVQ